MRLSLLTVAVFTVASAATAQDSPECASLLTAEEVRTTCGVPEAAVEVSTTRSGNCRLTAQREGTASMLTVQADVFPTAEEARATVGMAAMMGRAAEGQTAPGEGNAAMGQVAEMLGIQAEGAPGAEAVSDEEATYRDLPDLGDGGARYVTDLSGASGAATHTVVFSDGARLVKLESVIVAGRAGVCTADGLEVLARRVASRL